MSAVTAFSWIELGSDVSRVIGLGDDTAAGPLPLGFAFPFYGRRFDDFFVGSNGIISFERGVSDHANTIRLSRSGVAAAIAVFWDDLEPGTAAYRTFET